MNRILLVEDSPEIYHLVRNGLPDSSFELDWAKTVGEACAILNKKTFDLILLDVLLPDGDGFRLCSLLRANDSFRNVPVIFVSGRTTSTDQVLGFTVGADDYLTKPFDPLELKVRVEARLRFRSRHIRRAQLLCIADLEINKDTRKVNAIGDGQTTNIDLTPLEFKILLLLASTPNKALSRDVILNSIWGDNVHVFNRSIDTHVSKLRKKLGPRADYIQSVHGMGYKFRIETDGELNGVPRSISGDDAFLRL